MASAIANTPPTNFPITTGVIISGTTPAVNPKWSPKAAVAQTNQAVFTTFPLDSYLSSFYILEYYWLK